MEQEEKMLKLKAPFNKCHTLLQLRWVDWNFYKLDLVHLRWIREEFGAIWHLCNDDFGL